MYRTLVMRPAQLCCRRKKPLNLRVFVLLSLNALMSAYELSESCDLWPCIPLKTSLDFENPRTNEKAGQSFNQGAGLFTGCLTVTPLPEEKPVLNRSQCHVFFSVSRFQLLWWQSFLLKARSPIRKIKTFRNDSGVAAVTWVTSSERCGSWCCKSTAMTAYLSWVIARGRFTQPECFHDYQE